MNKPRQIRDHLLKHVSELRNDPDRLLVFIESGKLRCTAAVGLSFEYAFNLQLIITDFAGHPDSVMIPLLDWIRLNQPELLANYDKNSDAIQFDAEVMTNDLVDLSITLPLTERVIVKGQDGELKVTHATEPQLTDHYPQQRYDLIMDDESVANWQSAAPRWHDIETPHPKPRS